ncbi:DUF6249 domain-containing protein [Rhizosphaericola mali]|nr:DUF6249 domain-containing protein [Rhizosphaericola mali]
MDNSNLAIFWLIIMTIGILLTIFGIFYLKNKENIAMIERGMNPKLPGTKSNVLMPRSFTALRIGLPLGGAGLGLFFAGWINETVFRNDIPAIYFGLILLFAGIGFIVSYKIEVNWIKRVEAAEKKVKGEVEEA